MLHKTLEDLREAGFTVPDESVFKPEPPQVLSIPKTTFSIQTITPAIAEQWLATQVVNRHTSGPIISRFSGAMQRGEWVMNGESIKFDADGHLVDGQHRLRAVIHSGVPMTTLVATGLSPQARETVDIGHSRAVSDILAMRGERWSTVLAAALRQMMLFRASGSFGFGGNQSSPQQLIALLDAEPALRDWLHPADRIQRKLRIPRGMLVAILYTLSRIDPKLIEVFTSGLEHGEGLSAGNPILTAREMFLLDVSAPVRMGERRRAEILIRAWNALRRGEELRYIRGVLKEFPKPR